MSEDEVFPGAVENDPAGNHAPRSRRRLRKARSHHGPASPIRGRSRVVAILAAVAVFLLTIVTAFVGSGSSQASAPAKSAPVSAPAKPAPAACKASDIKVAAFHTTVTFSFAASGCASGVNIEFGDAADTSTYTGSITPLDPGQSISRTISFCSGFYDATVAGSGPTGGDAVATGISFTVDKCGSGPSTSIIPTTSISVTTSTSASSTSTNPTSTTPAPECVAQQWAYNNGKLHFTWSQSSAGTLVETSDVALCKTSQVFELYQVPNSWDRQGWNATAGTIANPQRRVDVDTQSIWGKGPFTFHVDITKLKSFIDENGTCRVNGQVDKQPAADAQDTIWYPKGNTNVFYGQIFTLPSTSCPVVTSTVVSSTTATVPTTVVSSITATVPTTVVSSITATVPTTVVSSTTATVTTPVTATLTTSVTVTKPVVVTPRPLAVYVFGCKQQLLILYNVGVKAPAHFTWTESFGGKVTATDTITVPGNGNPGVVKVAIPGYGKANVVATAQYKAAGYPTAPFKLMNQTTDFASCKPVPGKTTSSSAPAAPVTVTYTVPSGPVTQPSFPNGVPAGSGALPDLQVRTTMSGAQIVGAFLILMAIGALALFLVRRHNRRSSDRPIQAGAHQ